MWEQETFEHIKPLCKHFQPLRMATIGTLCVFVEERENTGLTEREGEREKRKDGEMRERKKRERESERREIG